MYHQKQLEPRVNRGCSADQARHTLLLNVVHALMRSLLDYTKSKFRTALPIKVMIITPQQSFALHTTWATNPQPNPDVYEAEDVGSLILTDLSSGNNATRQTRQNAVSALYPLYPDWHEDTADRQQSREQAAQQIVQILETLDPIFVLILSEDPQMSVLPFLPSPLRDLVSPTQSREFAQTPAISTEQRQVVNQTLPWFGRVTHGWWTFVEPRRLVAHVMSQTNDPTLQSALQDTLCGLALDANQKRAWALWTAENMMTAMSLR